MGAMNKANRNLNLNKANKSDPDFFFKSYYKNVLFFGFLLWVAIKKGTAVDRLGFILEKAETGFDSWQFPIVACYSQKKQLTLTFLSTSELCSRFYMLRSCCSSSSWGDLHFRVFYLWYLWQQLVGAENVFGQLKKKLVHFRVFYLWQQLVATTCGNNLWGLKMCLVN